MILTSETARTITESMNAPIRRAMVLAAGFGSRLGDIGQLRPKPLLPVCDQPLLAWTLR